MRRIWRVGLVGILGLGLAGCAWWFTPPQAVLTAIVTPGSLTVQFSLSGSTGQITSWILTFGDGDSLEGDLSDINAAVSYDYANAGTYTATLTVQDARGRTSTATRTITVSALAAPVLTATLMASNTDGPATLSVTFTVAGAVTPPTGPKIESWVLDYGDGGPPLPGSVSPTYSFSQLLLPPRDYNTPGVWIATLTVKDADGVEATNSVTITVTSLPPVITVFSATFGVDTVNFDAVNPTLTILAGDTVDFDFEAQPAVGREIASYTLLCPGSNSPAASEAGLTEDPLVRNNLLRTYAAAGTYTATLQVWDDVGNSDLATLTIQVN